MNKERIGKFIAYERKARKLTQEKLAEKLGITKNAVSKWERGICLMDMSLLKPLSEILEVSITELLNGQRVPLEELGSKSEKILMETIDYSNNEIKKVKQKRWLVIILSIVITITSIILLDTIQAIVFKNSPVISWRVTDKNDHDSWIDKGILIDTYYCVKEEDIVTVLPTFKSTNYNCPLE